MHTRSTVGTVGRCPTRHSENRKPLPPHHSALTRSPAFALHVPPYLSTFIPQPAGRSPLLRYRPARAPPTPRFASQNSPCRAARRSSRIAAVGAQPTWRTARGRSDSLLRPGRRCLTCYSAHIVVWQSQTYHYASLVADPVGSTSTAIAGGLPTAARADGGTGDVQRGIRAASVTSARTPSVGSSGSMPAQVKRPPHGAAHALPGHCAWPEGVRLIVCVCVCACVCLVLVLLL